MPFRYAKRVGRFRAVLLLADEFRWARPLRPRHIRKQLSVWDKRPTAIKPVQTTFVGHPATYLVLSIPASLPCAPDQFYLWQDSPGGTWWILGLNGTSRVWIVEVGGQRVVIAARWYAGTSAELKTELQQVLDSTVFDAP